uniref:Uncharacterized protein n=1 Tax=Sphaerodactylus townsendi TaxID=933632 RepID=A0ACB8E812_9SAUR
MRASATQAAAAPARQRDDPACPDLPEVSGRHRGPWRATTAPQTQGPKGESEQGQKAQGGNHIAIEEMSNLRGTRHGEDPCPVKRAWKSAPWPTPSSPPSPP